MNLINAASLGRQRQRALLLALMMLFAFLLSTLNAVAAFLLPIPSGEALFVEGDLLIDTSNANRGYIMARHLPNDKPMKVRLSCGKASLSYDFLADGEYEVFPLQLGNGNYKVEVFQQASGRKYKPLADFTIEVQLDDETVPFTVPNQYVDYNADSDAVIKSIELCHGLENDWDKYEAIYRYMATHMIYDFDKARKVSTGYLPVVDNVLYEQKGICFDLAALMAAMLRTQGIPTQLVIGYADQIYHAWNLVYLDGQWYRCDITSDIMCMNIGRYTTERYY
ncbi:MAG: transglutaminase domain-containing protein [Clostridia bacterium]|nr:transglutaminase domain-containing protein [Clostridia bacterium]